jgi:hypothetical protein
MIWLDGISDSLFQVSHLTFSAFYLVNVAEASRVLKRKKPCPKKIITVLVIIAGLIIFGGLLYVYWMPEI